mgnify:CR=1
MLKFAALFLPLTTMSMGYLFAADSSLSRPPHTTSSFAKHGLHNPSASPDSLYLMPGLNIQRVPIILLSIAEFGEPEESD